MTVIIGVMYGDFGDLKSRDRDLITRRTAILVSKI